MTKSVRNPERVERLRKVLEWSSEFDTLCCMPWINEKGHHDEDCPRQRMNAELNAMLDEECTLPEMPPVLPPYTYTDPQSGCTALIIACVALSFVAVIAWRLVS